MGPSLSRGIYIRFSKRKVLLNLFLLLLLPAAAFFVFFPLRYGVYDASNVFTPCISALDGREHWARPNCRGMSRAGGARAEMQFNSEGIRDREYEARAKPGVFRILVLGSSNTLGPGIAEANTFPRQLERALRELGNRVEVINAAMVGYCTIQSSFRIKHLLERYSPQLVIYQFVQGACPLFDGAWSGRVEFSGVDPLRIDRSPFMPSGAFAGLNDFFFKHPSLFFLWLTAADQWRKAAFSREYMRPMQKQDRVLAYMEPTLQFLSYLRNSAREKGAGFEIVSYRMKIFTQSIPAQMHPWLVRLLAPLVKPVDFTFAEMLAVLHQNGFSYLYPSFPTEPYLNKGDMHLNEDGLLELARAIALGLAPTLPLRQKGLREGF